MPINFLNGVIADSPAGGADQIRVSVPNLTVLSRSTYGPMPFRSHITAEGGVILPERGDTALIAIDTDGGPAWIVDWDRLDTTAGIGGTSSASRIEVASISGNKTPDLLSRSTAVFDYTVTGDVTIDGFSGLTAGARIILRFTQDAVGNHAITLPGNLVPTNFAFNLFPTAVCTFTLVSVDGSSVVTVTGQNIVEPDNPTPSPPPARTYREEVEADLPILYMKMGETAGTTIADVSGAGHSGVISGTYTLGQPGALNGDPSTSIRLNTGPITISSASWARLNASWAIEFWIYIVTDPAASTFPGIIKYNIQADGWLIFYGSTRQISFRWNNVVKNLTPGVQLPSAGTWSHVVIEYDEPTTTLTAYLNKNIVSSFTNVAAVLPDLSTIGNLLIGQGDFSAQGDHRIDETAIYDHTIGATRIAAHYDANGVPINPGSGAVPLFLGDTWTLTPQASYPQGGEGPLPPYQYSSAWNSSRTPKYVVHSNSNPAAHGVTIANDPLGHISSRTGITRKVVQSRNIESYAGGGNYSRCDLRTPLIYQDGYERWIYSEILVPSDFPTFPSSLPSNFWWNFREDIYGSPYGGTAPSSLFIKRNLAGTGNDMCWQVGNDVPSSIGQPIWRRAFTKGRWHCIARRVKISTSAAVGWSELYASERDPTTGVPTGAMTLQTLIPVAGITLVNSNTRRNYAALVSSINGTGNNHSENKNYHMQGYLADNLVTYCANFRVYDGAATLAEIDPFVTGLV